MKKAAVMLGNLAWIIGMYLISIQTMFKLWDLWVVGRESMQTIEQINFRVAIIVHDLFGLLLYFSIFKLFYKKSIFKISRLVPMNGKTTGIIVVLSILMGVWMMCLVRIPYVQEHFPQFNEAFEFLLGRNVAFFIVFWIVHSFYKEIFFRGLIFNQLQKAFPTSLSIFVLGIIYGGLFFNWDPALSAYGMLGAVILCLIYMWTGSIWSTILSEFVLFSTYFAIYRIDPPFGAILAIVMLFCSIMIIYLMYLLWKNRVPSQKQFESGSVEISNGF